jgi:LysM repeat protein
MMRFRVWLPVILLVAAALACNLSTTGTEKTPNPTPLPTSVIFYPTATFLPTATLIPTATEFGAPCVPRTDWPTVVVVQGDTLYGIALRVNSTVDDLVQANCLADANTIEVGQRLYVPNAPPPVVTATPNPTCAVQWFFTFDPGQFDDTAPCPNPVVPLTATGEDFEGGRVLVYAAMPGYVDQRNTIYVIYNDGTWQSFVDTWTPGQPEYDPGIIPPQDRYQPARSIGKLWRENAAVHAALGWAYGPEAAFNGRFQEPTGYAGIWYNRNPYFYLDHGKWGLVLRLYTVSSGPNNWEVAGRY